jgi:hypothetical protein
LSYVIAYSIVQAERTDTPAVFEKNDYLGYNSFIELKNKLDGPLPISVILTRLFDDGAKP